MGDAGEFVLTMVYFSVAAVLSFIVDQLSKIWIRNQLLEGDIIPLIPGIIHLGHVQNKGAAWGMLSGQKWVLIGFTVFVIGMIVTSAREVSRRGKLAATGFGLILGGAVGNLTDRILFGHVTDYFDLDTSIKYLREFPVFNVADSALTVGVILMLLSLLFARPESSPAESKPESETKAVNS